MGSQGIPPPNACHPGQGAPGTADPGSILRAGTFMGLFSVQPFLGICEQAVSGIDVEHLMTILRRWYNVLDSS